MVSLAIGILGNIMAEAVLSYYSIVFVWPWALFSMLVVVIVYLILTVQYGPKDVPRIAAMLTYRDLLKSYNDLVRDSITYLMSGAGLRAFRPFAKQVLERTLRPMEMYPFFGKVIDVSESSRVHEGEDLHFGLSGKLDEVARRRGLKGIKASLNLILHATARSYYPTRVTEVDLTMNFSIMNPAHRFADEFVTQVVKPSMEKLVEWFSREFVQVNFHKLQRIMELRGLHNARIQYCESQGLTDEWDLMSYYPYDGESGNIIVMDRSFVSKRYPFDGPRGDPIWNELADKNLWGSYVTDCDKWPSLKPSDITNCLLDENPHIVMEAHIVMPSRIVTIGSKAKAYVDAHLQKLGRKPIVVNILEDFTEIVDRDVFRQNLSRSLAAELDGHREK
jgi:hypothetical protein